MSRGNTGLSFIEEPSEPSDDRFQPRDTQVQSRHVVGELIAIAFCAALLFVVAHAVDLLETLDRFAHRYEAWEVDELVSVALFLLVAAFIFAYRRLQESKAAQLDLQRRNSDLQSALDRIRTLEGILPICCYCKKIQTDSAQESENPDWVAVETYVRDRTHAEFSHAICPECMEKYHAED